MKIGIYGGTFDPIHRGHITAAQAAAQQLGLDLLHFIKYLIRNCNIFKNSIYRKIYSSK